MLLDDSNYRNQAGMLNMEAFVLEYGTIARLAALRDLLVAEECDQQAIFSKLSNFYPSKAASTKKLKRDLISLQAFGYTVEAQKRPLRWRVIESFTLTEGDIQTLRMIHDAFGEQHPFSDQIQQLISKLTQNLTLSQQRAWQRPIFTASDFAPVRDYASHAQVMRLLNEAMRVRRQIRFLYTPKAGNSLWHTVDPYQIELRDRQYYLEAYSYASGYVSMFRIDRIATYSPNVMPEILPTMQNLQRSRPTIHFVYRLSHALAAGGVSARFTIHDTQSTPEGVFVYASDSNEIYIIRTLLAYGEHAVLIDGPPSLRERLHQELKRMYANYVL